MIGVVKPHRFGLTKHSITFFTSRLGFAHDAVGYPLSIYELFGFGFSSLVTIRLRKVYSLFCCIGEA